MSKNPKKRPVDPSIRPLLRSLLIEIVIYIPLVGLFFVVVLRYASPYLTRLYDENLTAYAVLALVLILAQGTMLEVFTSWLLRKIGLRH
jgi:hypothetical protein